MLNSQERDGYLQCDEFYSAFKSNKLIIHWQRVIPCELFISNIKRVIEWAEKNVLSMALLWAHDCHCFISDYLPMKSHKIYISLGEYVGRLCGGHYLSLSPSWDDRFVSIFIIESFMMSCEKIIKKEESIFPYDFIFA